LLLSLIVYGFGCGTGAQTAGKREQSRYTTRDVENDESGLIPMKICSFVRENRGITIVVYQFGEGTASSLGTFHGNPIQHVTELDMARTTATIRALTSASTYSTAHVGCLGSVGTGIGMSLRSADGKVDIMVDLLCKHVIDADSHDEIGILSRSGDAFLRRIATDTHIRPVSGVLEISCPHAEFSPQNVL